jgi:hypothetical protein
VEEAGAKAINPTRMTNLFAIKLIVDLPTISVITFDLPDTFSMIRIRGFKEGCSQTMCQGKRQAPNAGDNRRARDTETIQVIDKKPAGCASGSSPC